jgi:hypothetical protein
MVNFQELKVPAMKVSLPNRSLESGDSTTSNQIHPVNLLEANLPDHHVPNLFSRQKSNEALKTSTPDTGKSARPGSKTNGPRNETLNERKGVSVGKIPKRRVRCLCCFGGHFLLL